jgi:response regulator RpfG family c-di-GMP phosphodiesterase
MQANSEALESTVTIVDDEPFAQEVLVRAARCWRYECQAANSAEQAIELLEKRLTPIVITDLRMPGKGGYWLVQEIRRRWPHVTVIVVTAGQDEDSAGQCLRSGVDHFFLKPVKLDEFYHVLETARRSQRTEQEKARYRQRLERRVLRQTRRIRHTFLSAIDSLVRAMEERDPYTAGHSLRVREYALQLSEALGLTKRAYRQLGLAARLHDIGKAGVPEAVLNKAGPLTLAEDLLIRDHPAIGERILAPIIRDADVLSAIRGHHERIDGNGYPDHLAGEQIPILARIIAVADAFDAMTSRRAYRQPMTKAQALDELHAGAGKHFDGQLIHHFLRLHTRSAR